MKIKTYLLLLFLPFLFLPQISAQNCTGGIAQYSLNDNNVNIRLNTTGNLWWNGTGDAGYEFPAGSGKHLIFTGGLWMAGRDSGGNLRLAAQTYGSSSGEFDFYPGPIDPNTLTVSETDCANWDLIFEANRSDNLIFLNDFTDNGQIDNPIPSSISGWPARGNPNFQSIYGFELPDKSLAPFVDQNGDGVYNPMDGDYPKIKGTSAAWWVYNDIGNNHDQSGGIPLGMEIQAMDYAYSAGNDLVSNTTFYDFKLIYYGVEPLSDYYTSLFVDPDIGCPGNDYIGCDPVNNLGYAYNGENLEVNCGSIGYGEDIPMVGIKILKSTTTENGMFSGFSYYFNSNETPTPIPGTTDPSFLLEFYNYMRGLWADGTPLSQGGNGYNIGGAPYPFAFDNALINGTPWTECTANLPFGDRRFLMNFGPINLIPGQIQTLSFAVVAKTDILNPCPAIDGLIEDTDFIADFDSTLTALQDNPVPMAPLAGFSFDFLSQVEVAFTENSFFDPTEWLWDFGDGNTSTERFPTHTYAEEGTYTVCLTASNSLGSDTYCRDLVITIILAPVADFDFANPVGLNVIFQDQSLNDPTSYFWDFGDGETATNSSLFHVYPNPELYTACLTVTNGGGEDTVCKEIDLRPTSTDDLSTITYNLYPNPAQDFLYLDFSESVNQNLDIKIFDVLGKIVNPEIQKNNGQFEITVNELPKGLYFFELIDHNKKRETGKFIVN